MAICPSIFTTIPKMNSLTSPSSMRTWFPRVRIPSIWRSFAPCRAVKLPVPRTSEGSLTSCSLPWTPVIGRSTAAARRTQILVTHSHQPFRVCKKGKFPAIPRNDGDLAPAKHIQAIANTAGFHFAFIEQGGTSLYPMLAQRVSHPVVLRILLSIGPTETAHFQTWQDKAGNARPLTDPTNGLVFPDLNATPFGGEDFQTNLIMPEPCPFLSRKFPPVSIIRPTETQGAAMGALKALTDDGLFRGQSPEFFAVLQGLAVAADAARHGG